MAPIDWTQKERQAIRQIEGTGALAGRLFLNVVT
jgi:hypothetical protein